MIEQDKTLRNWNEEAKKHTNTLENTSVKGTLTSKSAEYDTHGVDPDYQLLYNATGGRNDMVRRDEDEEMKGDDPMPEASLAARAGTSSSGSSQVSKETPISSYPSISYGLPETHTCILPHTTWLTAVGLSKSAGLPLKIRMNSPYDMINVDIGTYGTTDGTRKNNPEFLAGLINPDNRTQNAQKFPETTWENAQVTPVGPYAGERPQWRDYYAKIYDYYTVLGCEYEIIMYNPLQMRHVKPWTLPTTTSTSAPAVTYLVDNGAYCTDCVAAIEYDTYSATATTTGNVMPVASYADTRAFKNIRWEVIKGGQKAVIRGHYKPGDAKRNIVNDGDVKTWTATGSAPPTLTEILNVSFFQDPFFNAQNAETFSSALVPTSTGGIITGTIMMEINLKYIVQFKDLKLQARYPNGATASAQDISQVISNSRTTGDVLQRWQQ